MPKMLEEDMVHSKSIFVHTMIHYTFAA